MRSLAVLAVGLLLQGASASVDWPLHGVVRGTIIVRNETSEIQGVEFVGWDLEMKVLVPSMGRVVVRGLLMPESGMAVCTDRDHDGEYEFEDALVAGRRVEWVVRP